jgi:hypothetical protein
MPAEPIPATDASRSIPLVSRPRPRPKSRGFSRPELHHKVTLHSTHAQRVAGRNMIRVARALYTIGVILHVIGDQDQAEQVETIVAGKIREVSDKLQANLAQLHRQRTESGIDQIPKYASPLTVTFRISSPQLSQYASLIQGLDALTVETDTLWLGGLLTSRQHANIAYQWRRALVELAVQITDIEQMARTSAIGVGAAEEIAAGDAAAKGVVTVEDGGELDLDEDDQEAHEAA